MTSSREDYLKAIAELQRSGERVGNRHIADYLGVSAASVSEIIRKMEKEGLVESMERRSIRLTRKGEAAAMQLVRIHRLWEVFLVEHLGYSWGDVHEEAEKLEHAASPRLMEKTGPFSRLSGDVPPRKENSGEGGRAAAGRASFPPVRHPGRDSGRDQARSRIERAAGASHLPGHPSS